MLSRGLSLNVSGVTLRGAGMGRSTVHTEGVLLITEWIVSLEGGC